MKPRSKKVAIRIEVETEEMEIARTRLVLEYAVSDKGNSLGYSLRRIAAGIGVDYSDLRRFYFSDASLTHPARAKLREFIEKESQKDG